LPLPGLSTRSVDLENLQPMGYLWPALGEGVKARAEDDVLSDAVVSLFRYEVLDKASAYHNTRTVASHGASLHVRTVAPSLARTDQLEANLVFKHMRRRVNFNV
jgi:hypothetical protein